jgi:hypothetical protein
MSNMLYQIVLPTSVEPSSGFVANDRVVFEINHEAQQMRPKTFRLNGVLNLSKIDASGNNNPITPADKLMLNPNAGINGFIRQIQTSFGSSTVETLNEYGRFVALKNETKYYQIDNCTSSNSMLELMTFSNNADVQGDDLKVNLTPGMKFPIDESTTFSELPFSLDLDICLNGSEEPLPYSRTGQITVAIIFQDNNKCGMKQPNNDIVTTVQYVYAIKNLECRFIADPEQEHKGGIILETKCNAHIPTILNKISALEFSPSNEFDSVVCSFLKQGHDSTSNSFLYDYLASEAITEQIEYLEVKLNGQDKYLKYPLRFQTSEILYNYLLAWKPIIHGYEDSTVTKHGLSYGKLGNGSPQQTIPTGFGVGCNFHGGIEAGNKVCFNISLKTAPATPYRCFFYTIGKLII